MDASKRRNQSSEYANANKALHAYIRSQAGATADENGAAQEDGNTSSVQGEGAQGQQKLSKKQKKKLAQEKAQAAPIVESNKSNRPEAGPSDLSKQPPSLPAFDPMIGLSNSDKQRIQALTLDLQQRESFALSYRCLSRLSLLSACSRLPARLLQPHRPQPLRHDRASESLLRHSHQRSTPSLSRSRSAHQDRGTEAPEKDSGAGADAGAKCGEGEGEGEECAW